MPRIPHICLVAGEHSGDRLGAKLMRALRARSGREFTFSGVGGEAMSAEGLESLFPLSDVAVMGPVEILSQLPKIIARVYQTKRHILDADPAVLVILDSPEFTHPIAKRVRRARPALPIIDYVSPSVWAWRPGRARKMRGYIDHILALLPFEPAVHQRLGGPACSYVGHPLIEQSEWIAGLDPKALAGRLGLSEKAPVLAVLPGSRSNEINRLMEPFGRALGHIRDRIGVVEVILPTVESARPRVEHGVRDWPLRPHIVLGEQEKFQAFRLARAALAASGTVTLELALSATPMVVAYKIDPLSALFIRSMIKAQSIVLPNLILEKNAFPEFIQEECTPERLAEAITPLIGESPARQRQLEALEGLEQRMRIAEGTPSERAAEIVLGFLPAD